jgi:hypothetical protein
MANTTLRIISDSGHAWLEVTAAELAAAGFSPSRYSYRTPGMAYLEEDCDLPGYLAAAGIDACAVTWRETYIDGDCWVRDLDRFPRS